MSDDNNRADSLIRALRYSARGVSTGVGAFLVFFALGETVSALTRGGGVRFDRESVMMGSYFVAIAIGVGLGWWRDLLAGIVLAAVGLIFTLVVLTTMEPHDYWITLIFGLPFLLCGLLFVAAWGRQRLCGEPVE